MTKPPRSESGTFRRHTRDAECPVCDGHDALPQGKGVRCAGFSLDFVAYCTREEYAGNLPLDISTEPPAYVHRLFGSCLCGRTHGFTAPERPTSAPRSERVPGMPLTARNEIYSAALDLLRLRPEAEHDLTRRGLDCADINHAGYRSIPRKGSEVERFLRALVERFGEEGLRRCPASRIRTAARVSGRQSASATATSSPTATRKGSSPVCN